MLLSCSTVSHDDESSSATSPKTTRPCCCAHCCSTVPVITTNSWPLGPSIHATAPRRMDDGLAERTTAMLPGVNRHWSRPERVCTSEDVISPLQPDFTSCQKTPALGVHRCGSSRTVSFAAHTLMSPSSSTAASKENVRLEGVTAAFCGCDAVSTATAGIPCCFTEYALDGCVAIAIERM